MADCIFCKIVNGKLATKLLYEDEHIIAFNDIHPKAPVHILVIPKQHIKSLAEINASHTELLTHLMIKLKTIASTNGLQHGFKTMINTGPGGGQEIDHLHFHILGSIKQD